MSYRTRQGDGQFLRPPSAFNMVVSTPDAPKMDAEVPYPIMFPLNYAVPDGAESLNYWNIIPISDFPLGMEVTVLRFRAPSAGITRILYYSLYSSVGVGDRRVRFLPKKDGTRAYPYHGNPNDSFEILATGGVTESLGANSLAYAPLTLLPNQELAWYVITRGVGDPPVVPPAGSEAGVRIVGYVDQEVDRHQMFMRNA